MNTIFSIILHLFARNSYSIRDELCEHHFSYSVVIDSQMKITWTFTQMKYAQSLERCFLQCFVGCNV